MIVLDDLPTTATGKVAKSAVRALLADASTEVAS
jgi:acyl-coenzyme A synthetase/AMP-(fatty) acid ligase